MTKKLKIIITVIVVTVIAVVIGVIIYLNTSNGDNGLKKADVDLSQVDSVSGNSTDETASPSATPSMEVIDDEGHVAFIYDANESDEDYLSTKTETSNSNQVSIEGSGTVVYADNGEASAVDDGTLDMSNITGTMETEQRFWMEAAKEDGYIYETEDVTTGHKFSVYKSGKYDITPIAVSGGVAMMSAPNSTTVRIAELNLEDGDLDYWREAKLTEYCFGYYSIIPGCSIPYDTEYILGSGLADYESIECLQTFYEDPTVNESNNQLLCEFSISTRFGDGYYFETFNEDTGTFTGTMILQHGTRIYELTGNSEYKDSLKDIITATADRCIYIK